MALLQDAFSSILQDDLNAPRRSPTQASSREPRSSVVKLWLALVLACQGRAGAAEEMQAALELNPFVIPPTLQALFKLEADAPPSPGVQWTIPLKDRSPGLTYAALGGSGWLHPSRWAVGKIGGKISPDVEDAVFSDKHAWTGRYSSIL